MRQRRCRAVCKTKTGSPLGAALLRPLAWWWCASTFSADWLLNLAQLFGLPFRWANYEANASQATIDALCAMLENMGSAGWAALPAGAKMDMKADGQKSGDETPQGNMLDRADKQCDLLLLGQTLTGQVGEKGGGSLALGKVHEGVKYEIVMAAADFVEGVVNDQVIPSIVRLNYGEESECPRLVLSSEDESDLKLDSQIVSTLASAGAGQIIGLDWLGKKFNIPKPGPEERTLGDAKRENGSEGLTRRREGAEGGEKGDEEIGDRLKALCAEADDDAFVASLRRFNEALTGGDFAGHPFRGNQWTKFSAPDKGGETGGEPFDAGSEIAKGNAAVERAIAGEDVWDAMQLEPEVGTVSFISPKTGRAEKDFHDGGGLMHLVAARTAEGKDGAAIARKMPEVLARGTRNSVYGPPDARRMNITHQGHTAVLSLYLHGARRTWLLTGLDYEKK